MPTLFDFALDEFFDGPEVANTPLAIEATRSFGTDIYFNGITELTAQGDYRLVEGERNLRLALLRRYITSPGSYKLRPGYGAGLRDLVKKRLTSSVVEDVKNRVRTQTLAERRVDRLINVAVEPRLYSGVQGLRVLVQVQAQGRLVRPLAYNFVKEA